MNIDGGVHQSNFFDTSDLSDYGSVDMSISSRVNLNHFDDTSDSSDDEFWMGGDLSESMRDLSAASSDSSLADYGMYAMM